MWRGDFINRARLCVLDIPGKFTAETLVIYPPHKSNLPILGTEYISIADKKFFGAIDFHPLSSTEDYEDKYIHEYLYDLPDRSVEISKFYDLSKFFSSKFWINKSSSDFYHEYQKICDKFLNRYKLALEDNADDLIYDNFSSHVNYDEHMGSNDPAHGILKAYFSESFADFYINNFLFASKQCLKSFLV
jgi:hypothetical protein